MKVYQYESREHYLADQIKRSRGKSSYCKVFFSDVIRYRQLLGMDRVEQETKVSPILCLGVRSGAEINLFRAVFFGPLFRFDLVRQRAIRTDTTNLGRRKIELATRFGAGAGNPSDGRVIGVELAPDVQRPDLWIGSFDEMPAEWSGRFRVIYSNSFDHSQDPERTVAEWKRVAAPGAYVILAFSETHKETYHDPVGGIGFAEMIDLWDAPIVFATETFNTVGYKEICFKLSS
jgi:hypothetical protein